MILLTAPTTKPVEILAGVPLVELNQAVQSLAVQFLSRSNLPSNALPPFHGMDYLLT
jgi:hypothetical protein